MKPKRLRQFCVKGHDTFKCGRYKNSQCKICTKLTPEERANLNSLFYTYKKAAAQRGIDFLLTKVEFELLTKKNCGYCGREPSQIHGKQETFGTYVYNGIDRLDSNKSYVLNNCISCCKTCNYAKREMSVLEFKAWITQVYDYLGKGV